MESKSSQSDPNELDGIDIIDIGELSWSDRIRPKPKIQGNYLRGDLIGQGTFAKVYEVMDVKTLQRRAVKVFDMHKIDRKLNRDEMVHMINQEVTLLARCHHHNVIRMIEVKRSVPLQGQQMSTEKVSEPSNEKDAKGKKDNPKEKEKDQQSKQLTEHRFKHHQKNKIWVYLEYCMASVAEIMNLSDPVKCTKLPLHQARHYFIGLINGLDYLHAQGIYHKDIKPDNMLINVCHTIKITDLSVSHVVDPFNQTDTCYNTYGTISYQSPEVISSSDSGFSASALDIWSSGVTLYVMINGKLPFSTINGLIAMTQSIQKDEPVQTNLLIDNPCLSNLIDCMLDKNPSKRIKLSQLLNHRWLQADLKHDKPYIKIPPRYAYGDQYRSLTITAYLHELHYPLPSQHNIVTVSETSADEFNVKRKIPIVRANRSPSKRRSSKRRPSLIVRQLKPDQNLGRLLGSMGLEFGSSDSNSSSILISSRSSSITSESN